VARTSKYSTGVPPFLLSALSRTGNSPIPGFLSLACSSVTHLLLHSVQFHRGPNAQFSSWWVLTLLVRSPSSHALGEKRGEKGEAAREEEETIGKGRKREVSRQRGGVSRGEQTPVAAAERARGRGRGRGRARAAVEPEARAPRRSIHKSTPQSRKDSKGPKDDREGDGTLVGG
jgi:hypothetical protein